LRPTRDDGTGAWLVGAKGDTLERAALRALLEAVAGGRLSLGEAEARLSSLPAEDLGFARLDHQRPLRDGLPEAVLAAGKTPEECATLAERIVSEGDRLLVTRANAEQAAAVQRAVPDATYHARAGCLTRGAPTVGSVRGVLICSAGTADMAVADEATLTAEMMDCAPERLNDVGVAGLHRLLSEAEALRRACVIVVVAGMDGALASVVAGLTAVPVIAVPTSQGYGAAFEGLAALLAMLNACAPGVGVVNIDNGFGAGYLAATIARASALELPIAETAALTRTETAPPA
jgi:NCAIR mutase (PurE)-related protein